MGRPVSGSSRRDRLPELAEGIGLHAEHMARSFPGLRSATVGALERGEAFTITAAAVWAALWHVNRAAATDFRRRHGGPWGGAEGPAFNFDPRTATLEEV